MGFVVDGRVEWGSGGRSFGGYGGSEYCCVRGLLGDPQIIVGKKAPYFPSLTGDLHLLKDSGVIVWWGKMIDLGCGDGKVLRYCMKHCGIDEAEGYDISRFALWNGSLFNKIKKVKNVNLYRHDMFGAEVQSADYVYIFLLPSQMQSIQNMLEEQLANAKTPTVVIVNAFPLPEREASEVIENKKGVKKLYVYRR